VSRLLVASLVVYAAIAAAQHWWPSVIGAVVVAALLWWRHPSARFAAYIFFTVLAIRGTLGGVWLLPAFALAAVALMQTAAAQHAWPRLVPGRLRGGDARDGGDRMRRS
jgi:type VI protein secretion system component VasK